MGTRQNRLGEAVLTSTHNLCFEQKYEKISEFLFEKFQFLEVKFSIYLNRRVFVMGQKVITIAHPEHSSGELKIKHEARQFQMSVVLTHWFFGPSNHRSHFVFFYKVLCVHVGFGNPQLQGGKVHNGTINRLT